MGLKEKLQGDLKTAMRAGDERRKMTLRLALDAIHKAEIPTQQEFTKGEAKGLKELDDQGILRIIASEARKRKEAIVEFEKGGRADLVAAEQGELAILQEYLPQELSEEEITRMAQEVIAQLGVKDGAQMGLVMKGLMPKVQGRAEGKTVSNIVRRLLDASR